MDLTCTDPRAQGVRHHLWAEKAILFSGLPRAARFVLIAILTFADNSTLSTERFPVTIDRIVEASGYSRTHALDTLNELERAGYVRRERHRRQDPDGRWRNAPTTYYLLLPDDPAVGPEAMPEGREPITEIPRQRPAEAPSKPAAPKPTPKADPLPERHKAEPREPLQKEPERFTPEQVAFGGRIVATAEAMLEKELDKGDKFAEAAIEGVRQNVGMLGKTALETKAHYQIDDTEIGSAVKEWIAKCVLKNGTPSPRQSAERLRIFMINKGHAIEQVRQFL